jgi:Rrf2 family iron-sulfur cluster assembly transcriptional regulator
MLLSCMLSKSAEYALRIMAALAEPDRATKNLVGSQIIAKETDIPAHYLSKILRRMVEAKLLYAVKGHNGGFRLAKPAKQIRFVDILEAVEGKSKVPLCVFGWDACSDKTPCVLHHRWKEARVSFQGWAVKTTLQDVKEDIDNAGISTRSTTLRQRQATKKKCISS